jgi:acetyltransferase-like isoleucine patch superfamily enzyme
VIVGAGCKFLSGHTDNLIGINRPCFVSVHNAGTVVKIGEGSGFSGTVIGAFKGITIGRNVKCGANTLITDGDWHPEDARSGEPREVVIGDNVWLGVGVMVLKGAKIGDNALIGANSVVMGEIPANVVAGGNPCKVIRSLG